MFVLEGASSGRSPGVVPPHARGIDLAAAPPGSDPLMIRQKLQTESRFAFGRAGSLSDFRGGGSLQNFVGLAAK
ncbi:hypothetical protein JCM15765_25510 [Paradesulfitobacterium aromaticivorans]